MSVSFRRGAMLATAMVLILSGTATVRADVPYAQMAPLSRYLMPDRQAEIDLARSAAPTAIALHATVLVLGRHGYETAVAGTNGFTCLVERSWMAPFGFPEFWNWHMREPICYNAAASRSTLVYTLRRTDRVLAGETKAQMLDRIRTAVAASQLPAPAVGAMAYMLSKRGYLGDGVGGWRPHLMIYAAKADTANDGATWGANLPGSPVVFDSSDGVMPEPETIFMVPVARWSDGTTPVKPTHM